MTTMGTAPPRADAPSREGASRAVAVPSLRWRKLWRWRTWIVALAVLLLGAVLTSLAAWAEPKFPPLTGRIVDEANLLSAADRATLTRQLAELEKKSTDQLVVVTLKSLQGYEIADFGYRLGRAWGLGQKDRKDNGVLLIVAPSERKVRIEVGRGLEPVLTDATSRLIIESHILPAFRRGEFSMGVLAGAKDIQDVLLGDVEGVKARVKGAKRPEQAKKVDWFTLAFWGVFIGIVIFHWIQHLFRAPPVPAKPWSKMTNEERKLEAQRRLQLRRDRDRDTGWSSGSSSSSGSGSGWSSGGSSGSSDSGGFSGGGGDFGGGGASSDW